MRVDIHLPPGAYAAADRVIDVRRAVAEAFANRYLFGDASSVAVHLDEDAPDDGAPKLEG